MTNDSFVRALPEPCLPPEPQLQPQPRRWPVWLVVLALCGLPVALPLAAGLLMTGAGLALGAVVTVAGLALGAVLLLGGIGAGGVVCLVGGVAASLWGTARLLALDLGEGLIYLCKGALSSLTGLLMLALCAGAVYLLVRAFAWARGRRGGTER